jgi:UDP-N-acetylmuramate dehydrogenase
MAEIESIPLAQLTTLRCGAAPRRMIEATTRDELIQTLRAIWAEGDDWFVLGGGSNLFVGDDPFDGTVVLVRTQGIERLASPFAGRARVRVEAGHEWDDLVAYTVAEGLAGIEAMSGIPGTVGAAPVQNVGAYGQEIQETLVEVELLDEATGEVSTVAASELGLGFRTSVLKHHYGSVPLRRAVILSVTFDLAVVGAEGRVVSGEQLRSALRLEASDPVPLEWVREQVLAIRASKGMVLDATDPDTTSAGSFFQNPIISDALARTLPPECPRWPVAPDRDEATVIPLAVFDGEVPPFVSVASDVKVGAAWLIEQAGLKRGFKLPGSRAGLSTKHALALTNRGGASAEELAELARFVRSRVHAEFGLMLQPEPVLINVEL